MICSFTLLAVVIQVPSWSDESYVKIGLGLTNRGSFLINIAAWNHIIAQPRPPGQVGPFNVEALQEGEEAGGQEQALVN